MYHQTLDILIGAWTVLYSVVRGNNIWELDYQLCWVEIREVRDHAQERVQAPHVHSSVKARKTYF